MPKCVRTLKDALQEEYFQRKYKADKLELKAMESAAEQQRRDMEQDPLISRIMEHKRHMIVLATAIRREHPLLVTCDGMYALVHYESKTLLYYLLTHHNVLP